MGRSPEVRDAKLVIAGAPGSGKLAILNSVAARYGAPAPELFDIGSWKVSRTVIKTDRRRFEVLALDGPQEFQASEELLMKDASGVLFVIDVEPRRLQAAWEALMASAKHARGHGYDLRARPFVLQYHRADRHPGFDPAKLDAWLGVPTGEVSRYVTPDPHPDSRGGAFDALLSAVSDRMDPV